MFSIVATLMSATGAGSFAATVLQTLSLKISVLSRLDPSYPPVTKKIWHLSVSIKRVRFLQYNMVYRLFSIRVVATGVPISPLI